MSLDSVSARAASLPEIAERRAATQSCAIAYRFLGNGEDETGHLTYADLRARARRLATCLRGVAQPGDRAVLAYPAGLDFPVAFLACLYAGVIAVPVELPKRKNNSERLTAIARNCGASLFLTQNAARDRLPDVGVPWILTDEIGGDDAAGFHAAGFAPPDPGSIAYLQYTSGSTRAPSGAAISHRALMEQLEYYRLRAGAKWDDLVFVGWLPHTHDFGLVGFVLSALHLGVPYIAMPPSAFLRRPARWLEAISRYRGGYCGGPSFGYEMCAGMGHKALRGDVDLSCWRIASLGGDYISPATLERFETAFAPHGFRKAAWLPAYGLAETVLCATGRQGARIKRFDAAALRRNVVVPVSDDTEDAVRLVSCGSAMSGQQVLIVDPGTRTALPDNAVGEIWMTGRSLADGYWNDDAGTASHFHATLAGDDNGVRHLRTGDCGFRHASELFVTGRLKDLIVMNGENHAPDDIEQTIQAVPGLRPGCGAVVQSVAQDGARIMAVQEVSQAVALDTAALFARINRAVTERHGLTLDAIELIRAGSLPRTRNGKISRRACLAACADGTLRRVDSWQRQPTEAAPLSTRAIEQRMLAHLRQMLAVGTVAADDNLFEIGVDSLAVHRLLAWLKDSFNVEVPVEAVFEEPTVSRLAGVVADLRMQRSEQPAPPLASKRDDGGSIEVSAAAILHELRKLNSLVTEQTRLLGLLTGAPPPAPEILPQAQVRADASFALTETQREIKMLPELREQAETVFNIMMVLEFSAPPKAAEVRRALRAVTMQHEALRTALDNQQQRVLPLSDPDLCEVTLETAVPVRDWLRAERRRPFALDRAPLWRVTLLHCPDSSLLVLTAHHLILDGSSLPIFVRDFASHYSGAAMADAAPPRPMQFRDFCAAASSRRDAGGREGRKAYWTNLLGTTLPDWVLPGAIAPRTMDISYEADVHSINLDAELRAALVRRGAAANSTLFQTLLCAYFILLHRLSGQDRILIGIDAANRTAAGSDGVIGCCNTLVPIVMELGDSPTVAQFQDRLRNEVLQALERQDYTLTMWAEDQRIAFDPLRPFKITASMNMQRFPAELGGLTPRFDLEAQSVSQSAFGLALEVRDLPGAVRLDFIYNKQIFAAAAIERFAGYYRRLLEAMARDGEAGILALSMLPEAETRQLLDWSRVPQSPTPLAPFLHRFAAQVAATPLALAVACPRWELNYRDLQTRSDHIAQAIVQQRVPPGTVIGVLGERGCAYLAVVLAILKAGCIYLPLDPKAPEARLHGNIAQAGVGLLFHDVSHRETAARLSNTGIKRPSLLCIDTLFECGQNAVPGPQLPHSEADAPAYVMFTSGSSGTPKAAIISHGGMMNHLQAKIDALDLKSGDAVAQTASQSFDISVWQYLAPLLVGGCVRVLDDRITHDAGALFTETDRQGITVLQTVPSMLGAALELLISPGKQPRMKELRWLISTGEALPAELCRRWISLYPRVPIMNAYGPTECSDDVTHHSVIWPPAAEVVRAPIGRPIPGAELYVLNKSGYLAAAGAPGELFVGGRCVGLGYLNDPERTAAAFVPDAFSGRPESRLYRTGDLVRYQEDGVLDYLGRLDQQVKINGVRIEPREIEVAIQHDPAVLQCLVTTKQGPDGANVLIGYVVLRPGKSVLEGTLKAVARNSLPQSLIPSAIVFLDTLPLTPNGKVDLAALPEPDLRPGTFDHTPPSTPVEETLVRIWSEVIGSSHFGVHDDFFQIGGRSLDAARITKQAEDQFNIGIPLSAVFRTPTIAGFASFIEKQVAATK
jgi:amino acid adenylation domain-containing protein